MWGGDPKCEHEWNNNDRMIRHTGGKGKSTLQNDGRRDAVRILNQARKVDASSVTVSQGTFCHCGAWRGAFGLEPDWRMYIDHTVEVFREVRRVLRDDGTLWLNIGDSYATGAGAVGQHPGGGAQGAKWMSAPVARGHRGRQEARQAGKQAPRVDAMGPVTQPNRMHQAGFKPKDRMMMPARVAIALCDDGWWLRDEIIWRKPNPMPSSVEDRTTPAHEMVYLLTKRARYFYDSIAIAERAVGVTEHDLTGPGYFAPGQTPQRGSRSGNKERKLGIDRDRPDSHLGGSVPWEGTTRNKRSVWDVTTEPFPEAHFATFPTSLVEPMIKAGTSERGCCPRCQGPWERVTRRVSQDYDGSKYGERVVAAAGGVMTGGTNESTLGSSNGKLVGRQETLGWQPTCKCDGAAALAPIPAVVLDPFGGAGTVGLVADRLQRDAVLLELNPGYAEMARRRIDGDAPLFATKEAAE